MKSITLSALTIILGIALSTSALAQGRHDEKPHGMGKPAAGMGMMDDKQTAQMQEHMKKMQQQMEKLRATTDPKERQKLMQEHMQTMQENMKSMRGMGGGMMMGMMGGGQKGGPMMGGNLDMTGDDMMKRHEMMEKRMDMMQMMQ